MLVACLRRTKSIICPSITRVNIPFSFLAVCVVTQYIAILLDRKINICWPNIIMGYPCAMQVTQSIDEVSHKSIELTDCPIPMITASIFDDLAQTGINTFHNQDMTVRIINTLNSCLDDVVVNHGIKIL